MEIADPSAGRRKNVSRAKARERRVLAASSAVRGAMQRPARVMTERHPFRAGRRN
jgi:hypothetical protein